MAPPPMVCAICGRRLGPGQHVIQIMRVVGNDHRGDFVGSGQYIHVSHVQIDGKVRS